MSELKLRPPLPPFRRWFLVGAVAEQPIGDDLQGLRRKSFFYGGIFSGSARISVLEKVV
jgi:hypothetical protein